jgi:hypothetical protein
MKKRALLFLAIGLVGLMVVPSCSKEIEEPANPYEAVDYGTKTTPVDTVDPASLVGLHRNLFVTKCAVPGCHDGVFEPDFRTVQSTFSTLVYAPITKNNATNDFTYRVIPGDTNLSVLYERITNCCFVNDDDRMPQDNIGTGLPASDIQHVRQWIMQGAKNADGQAAVRPDLEPFLQYYAAVNTTFDVEFSVANNRVDSLIYNPFFIPTGTSNFYMAILVEDDITPLGSLTFNKLYLSTDRNDFSAAQSFTASFINIPGQDPLWLANVSTLNLTPGVIYYMRYYVNDGHHAANTEFPKNSSNELYKSYWSFIIQP